MSTTVATIVLQLALSVALSVLAMALMRPEEPEGGIKTEVSQSGEDTSAKIMCGYYATAGCHAAVPYTTDLADPNALLTYVLALSDVPVTEIMDDIIVDGRNYKITSTANEYGNFLDGAIGEYGHVIRYDGTQTTADPHLVSRLGSYPARPWGNTAILSGVAYAIDQFTYNEEKFSGIPSVKHVVKGIKLYDPRKDSTNGGTGTHRYDNQSTWQFSDNPVVLIYNLLRGIPIPGGSIYGVGVSADAFVNAKWFAAMNICDEPGTQSTSADWRDDTKRYRCGYEIDMSQEPLSVIDDLLLACGGMIAEQGGTYYISLVPSAPVASITDDDIIVTEPVESQPFQPLTDCVNTIRATYPNPRKLWETEDAKPYSKTEWKTEDQGLELVADVKLSAVPFPRQVRRLMREMGSDHRRRRVHTITLPPKYMFLNIFDQITWTSPERYYENKLFEIQGITISPDTLNLVVNLRERDPADYDLDAVSDALIPVVPDVTPVVPSISGVFGFDFSAISLRDSSSVARKPALKITWGVPNTWRALAYEIKDANGTIVKSDSTSATGGGQIVVSDGVLPNQTYQCRVKVNERSIVTEWSAWKSITTPDVRISPADISTATWDQISATAAASGITTVSALPSTGTLNQIVLLSTNWTLYRWNGSAWTTTLYAGISPGSLTSSAFASSIEPVSIVNGSTVPTTKTTNMIFLTGTGKMYRWNGSAYVASVPAADISGTLSAAQISSLAASQITGQLTSDQIASITAAQLTGTITAPQIANGAVTDAKIAGLAASKITGQLTAPQIAAVNAAVITGTITAPQIAPGAVTDDKIAELTAAKITGQLTSAQIASIDAAKLTGTITAPQIANGAVTDAKIAGLAASKITGQLTASQVAAVNAAVIAGQITNTQIGDDAISTRNLAAACITAGELAANSVTAAQIAANSITSAAIQAGAVTTSRLAANSVTAAQIAAGTITTGELAANCVTTAQIAAGSVTAVELAAGAVTTSRLAANSVTAAQIAAGAVTADQISAGAISARHMIVGDLTNLVPNGSNSEFAANVNDYWIKSPAADISYQTLADASNLYVVSVYKSNIAETAQATGVQYIPVTAGDKYYASIKYRGNASASAGAYLALMWYDATKTFLTSSFPVGNTPITTAWQTLGSEVVVPPGACFVRVKLYNHSTNTSASTVYFDCVNLRRKNGGELVVDGSITANQIASGTITTANLSANCVTTAQIAAGSVTAVELAAGAVTTSRLAANSVTAAQIAAGTITSAEIAAGAINASRIAAGTITAAQIAAGTITAGELAANSVTTTQIAAGSVTAVELAAGAVTTSRLAANCVTAAQIAAGTITSAEIAAGAINASRIAAGAITATALAANSVTTNALATNSVTSDQIAANSIIAGKIAAGAVGADQIAANEVAAKLVSIVDFENYLTDGKILDATQWTLGADTVLSTNLTNSATFGFANGGYIYWTMPATGATGLFNFASAKQFYVNAGTEYAVIVNARRRVANVGGFRVRVQYYDASNTSISTYDAINVNELSLTVTKLTGSFVPPAGTVSARISFLSQRTGTDAGAQIMIGDAAVRRKNGGELVVDGSITANHVSAGAITTNAIAAGAVTATQIAAGSIAANSAIIASGAIGSAQIADAAITTAKIANLSVDTLQIADYAVTIPVSSYAAAQLTFGGETEISSLVIDRIAGRPTTIQVSCLLSCDANVNYPTADGLITLYRNGTAIYAGSGLAIQYIFNAVSFFYVDNNTAGGTTTYTVTMRRGIYGVSSLFVKNRAMLATISKK
ncbi:phage tail protein [Rhodobacter capsulatus]|uniref:phage tail protein n=1 Tax=Rhodobacter capsulatus TaxID=1061 RepID=UPI0040290F01